ncbi:MAG: SAM-dependent chlorinase/fluorinase [Bacteroidota bacterium]
MPIVTLTSDFGLNDYYVALIKGAMLCENPNLNIIDITHNINNYDIVQGAYILKNAYSSFPKGTIHILSVNNFYDKQRRFLAVRYDGHFFVGPDNGIFSLLFDEIPESIYKLEFKNKGTFPIKMVFAKAVGHITNGMPFNEIGLPVKDIVERITFQPVIGPSQIRGAVIHIDNYENAVVNISRNLFEQIWDERSYEISFRRSDPILRINNNYYDVPIGETLCRFNSANYLEIAINMGKASSMLGLKIEDTVQIDFL